MTLYVAYNAEYNVLICKEHECAISAEFLYRHFRAEHDIPLQQRQEIAEYASHYIPTKASAIVYPRTKVMPVPYLRVIDAFHCGYDQCDMIYSTVGMIKKHCRVSHGWMAKDGERWSGTRAQTFFQGKERRFVCLRYR